MSPRRQSGPIHDDIMPHDQGLEAGLRGQRLDRWLWFSRTVNSRTLAAALIEAGKIRVNGVKVVKPSQSVKHGDIVTSTARKEVRILRVASLGVRRGPAAEAQLLYEDLTPLQPASGGEAGSASLSISGGRREAGSGRPTKRDRRLIERLQGRD